MLFESYVNLRIVLLNATARHFDIDPSYQAIIDMVSECVKKLDRDMIQKSYKVCGIDAMGNAVPEGELH